MSKLKLVLFCVALLQGQTAHSSSAPHKDRDLEGCVWADDIRQKLATFSSLEETDLNAVYNKMHHVFKEEGELGKIQTLWLYLAKEKNSILGELILDFFNIKRSDLTLKSEDDVLNPSILHALNTGSISLELLTKFINTAKRNRLEPFLDRQAEFYKCILSEVKHEFSKRALLSSSLPLERRLGALFSLPDYEYNLVSGALKDLDETDKDGAYLRQVNQWRLNACFPIDSVSECTAKRKLCELQTQFEDLHIPNDLINVPNIYEGRKLGSIINERYFHNAASLAPEGPLYALHYNPDCAGISPWLYAFDKENGYALWGIHLQKELSNRTTTEVHYHQTRTSIRAFNDFLLVHLVDEIYKVDRHTGKLIAKTGFPEYANVRLLHILESGVIQVLASKEEAPNYHSEAFRKDEPDQTVSLLTLDEALHISQTREVPLIGYMNRFSSCGDYLIQVASRSPHFNIWYHDGHKAKVVCDTTADRIEHTPVFLVHNNHIYFSRRLESAVVIAEATGDNYARDKFALVCLNLKTNTEVWNHILNKHPRSIKVDGNVITVERTVGWNEEREIKLNIEDGRQVE